MNHFQNRLARLQATMQQDGIDAIYLNYGADFTWITGLTAPIYYEIMKTKGDWVTGVIVPVDREPVLVLHQFFAIELPADLWIEDVRILKAGSDPEAFFAEVIKDLNLDGKTIAVDKMLWAQSLLALQSSAPSARYLPATDDYTDAIRVVKDDHEIALMEEAARITDLALASTVAVMKPGMTERDVAIEVDYQIRKHGGDGPSFYPGIIVVGNGSNPDRHIFTRNTPQVLEPGTTVAFDFGVLYKGYCSDFGRSAFIGEPNPDALRAYESITRANQVAMQEMGDGRISPAGLCDFVNDLVTADGFGEYYMYYGLGHSIGCDVHESPWIRPESVEPIRKGMCFTLEPKIWKPGVFYVRCEDVVVVGETAGRSLTAYSYDPIIIQ